MKSKDRNRRPEVSKRRRGPDDFGQQARLRQLRGRDSDVIDFSFEYSGSDVIDFSFEGSDSDVIDFTFDDRARDVIDLPYVNRALQWGSCLLSGKH